MDLSATRIRTRTLGQLGDGTDWRLRLAHDRPDHLLVWVTRGQGLALLDGSRRGIGAHNALFVPARTLFALDMSRQSIGHAIMIPSDTPLRLPEGACHLRIRDVGAQAELTHEMETAQREDLSARPLRNDALEAHAGLISVWLRRQLAQEDHLPAPAVASVRLSRRYCALLPGRFTSGDTVARYAQTLGVTATHLTRAVKSATGRTAAELLSERVLHEARRLLVETPETAKNISRYLGFGSAAYFSRFIQQQTGAPPSRLRKH